MSDEKRSVMKILLGKSFLVSICLLLVCVSLAPGEDKCQGLYGKGPNRFSLATGSPGELGLLKALAEAFGPSANATMCWKKAGSGESLKLLQEKQVDMIMVHAPAAEKKAVEERWATKKTLIGSNEFFIVGPPDDPAEDLGGQERRRRLLQDCRCKGQVFLSWRQLGNAQERNANLAKCRDFSVRRLVCGHQGFYDGHPQESQ